jgi:hypothetical protein
MTMTIVDGCLFADLLERLPWRMKGSERRA